jgi:hypothetical protein
MRRINCLLLSLFFVSAAWAQTTSPKLINYQAVIRGIAGNPLPNKTIKVVFDLHEAGSSGPIIFNETQTVNTNSLGLFSTQIGKVNSLAVVNWTNGPYYLDLLVDTTGGTNFVTVGSQQLVSTPFSLYAEKAGSAPDPAISFSNSTLFVGSNSVTIPSPPALNAGTGISITSGSIINTAVDQTISVTGTGNAIVTSAYPGFTVNTLPQVLGINSNIITLSNGGGSITLPATSTTPNTSVTASGIASVSTSGTNTFNIGVQTPTLNGTGGTTVSGSYPNFTINSPTVAPVITTSITGAGIATVSPSSGNSFTVNVAPVVLLSAGGTTVAGSYPNFTIGSPNYSISFPNASTAVLNNGLSSNSASIPQNTLTGVSGITVAGTGPTYTIGSSTSGTNTIWNTLGNSGTNPSVNFLGTTDAADLQFRTSNVSRMKISSLGNIGIGTPLSPTENLQVESSGFTKLSLVSPSSNFAGLSFGTSANHGLGLIQYNNSSNEMNFGTSATGNRLRLFGNGDAAFGSTLTANPVASFVNFCKQGANDTKVLISGGDNNNSWGGILAFGENETASQGMTIKLDAGANKLLITSDVNGFSPVVGIGGYSGSTNGVMIGSGYVFGNSPVDGLAVQGNVGIGTSSPAQKLEVAGNVQIPGSNDYLYSSPKQKYISVPANALLSMRPQLYNFYLNTYVAGYDGESGYGYFNDGTAGADAVATAPVYLPDGATVTELWVRYFDGDASYNLTVSLERKSHGTINNATMASFTSIGNSSGPSSAPSQSITAITSPVIDNFNNAYYVKFKAKQANTSLGILDIRIGYTVTKTD